MALNDSKCNHLMPLHFKGLRQIDSRTINVSTLGIRSKLLVGREEEGDATDESDRT